MLLNEKFELWLSMVEKQLPLIASEGYLLNAWKEYKKRPTGIKPDGKCHYTGWGRCNAPTDKWFCEKHIKFCNVCGVPIIKECTNPIGSLMCGAPKCDDHPSCKCR